jgi:hypothetical protein
MRRMQDYREEGSLCSNSDQGRKLFILQKLDIANPQAAKQKMESSSSISS